MWKAVTSKAKGIAHEKNQTPYQDYGDFFKTNENILIAALSDGMGSAKYADIGAKTAVEKALSFLNERHLSEKLNKDQAEKLFSDLLKEIQQTLEQQAHERKANLKDFNCTLLIVVATPKWLMGMQVGDGFIVVQQEEKDFYDLLFQPCKGEYANATVPITSPQAIQDMQVDVLETHYNFICVSTDGLEQAALKFGRNYEATAHTDFFTPFQQLLRTEEEGICKKEIDEWIDSEEVKDKSDDDKTVIFCIWEPHQKVGTKSSVTKHGTNKGGNNQNTPIAKSTMNHCHPERSEGSHPRQHSKAGFYDNYNVESQNLSNAQNLKSCSPQDDGVEPQETEGQENNGVEPQEREGQENNLEQDDGVEPQEREGEKRIKQQSIKLDLTPFVLNFFKLEKSPVLNFFNPFKKNNSEDTVVKNESINSAQKDKLNKIKDVKQNNISGKQQKDFVEFLLLLTILLNTLTLVLQLLILSRPDKTPTKTAASLYISGWATIPKKNLNDQNQEFDVSENTEVPVYTISSFNPQIPSRGEEILGYLPPGTYRYKNASPDKANTEKIWVKIELER